MGICKDTGNGPRPSHLSIKNYGRYEDTKKANAVHVSALPSYNNLIKQILWLLQSQNKCKTLYKDKNKTLDKDKNYHVNFEETNSKTGSLVAINPIPMVTVV